MAVLSANQLTLVDVAKRLDPDGSVADVAELLSQTNAILKDAVFKAANEKTSHRVTIRTGLPTVYYRALNQGTPSSKSTTAQVKESISLLEARSTVDMKELEIQAASARAEFLLSESRPFLEAMNQRQANDMFYGNPQVDQRQYLGLATRYSSLTAGNGANILNAGGASTNNTSIWLVCWGPETTFCTFPEGSKAGLQQRALGEQRVTDSNGNAYQAMETLFNWDHGLVVKDWRYVVRIANINTANLVAESAAADLVKLMSRAIDRIPAMGMGKCVFYANRTVMSMLKIQALNKAQNAIAIQPALTQFGEVIPGQFEYTFLGIPLRLCDQILNTESTIS
jgi:hypothetical protein